MDKQNLNSYETLRWLIAKKGWELLWPGMGQCDRHQRPILRYNAAGSGIQIQGFETPAIHTKEQISALMDLLQLTDVESDDLFHFNTYRE